MTASNGAVQPSSDPIVRECPETTVLVAVESPRVREALVAMLGAIDGFRVIAEADSDEAALDAARIHRPCLALVEPELSGCRGWWAIQTMQAEDVVSVIVALGRRSDARLAQLVGAQTYVQMGTPPRDLLSTLQTALALRTPAVSTAEAEDDLLANADAVLDKPACIDL